MHRAFRYAVAVLALALSAGPALAADPIGDPARGAEVFRHECAQCHEIGEGARNRIGPHLNRVFNRRAGSVEGFAGYSRALLRQGADGLIWRLETLDAYLKNPRALVSGTRMAYRGLSDDTARRDLLAFLREYSDRPQDIPEAAPTAIRREVELPPEVLAIKGDVEYGEYLAQECVTCHQRGGEDRGIPSIVGWLEEDFVIAMHAYRQRIRPNPVMQMIAARLGDEEIAALAAYFAQLEQ